MDFQRAASLLVAAAAFSLSAGSAQAYDCNTVHCYGVTTWSGPTKGASTTITIVSLNGGDSHINDELWLIQDHPGNSLSDTWVEVGETSNIEDSGGALETFAAARNFSGFFIVPGSTIPIPVTISRRRPSLKFTIKSDNHEPGKWAVGIVDTNDPNSPNSPNFLTLLPGIPMSPNTIEIGLELQGTTGASAPSALFTENMGFSGLAWGYQDTPGVSVVQPPVSAGWQTVPTETNDGGTFKTSCCTASPGMAPPPQPKPVQAPMITGPLTDAQARVNALSRRFPLALEASNRTIASVDFISGKRAIAALHTAATVADDAQVCLVVMTGKFTFGGPKGTSVSYPIGFELFDAKTGKLLQAGGRDKPVMR